MVCPMCESAHTEVLYQFPPSDLVPQATHLVSQIRIACCRQCHIVYSSVIRLSADELSQLYGADLFEGHEYWREVSLDHPETSPDAHLYEWAMARLGTDQNAPELLDIGCGLGVFLALARRHGWQVAGTELSDYAIDYVQGHLGCTVHRGEVEHLDLPPGSFDAVCGWDVLEHVRDVNAMIAACHRLLKPHGRLVIRTINENALLVRTANLIYRLTGGRVYGPARRCHEIYHLTYFTVQTLEQILARHGFTVEHRMMMDIPVERLGLSWPGKLLVRLIYAAQRLTGTQVEQLVIAQRH